METKIDHKERLEMPLTLEQKQTLTTFNEVWLAACAGKPVEQLKELAPNYTAKRIEQIAHAATMPIGDIIKMVGSQNDFSLHYCISKRTVQGWADKSKGGCPPFLRLMFCRDLKLI